MKDNQKNDAYVVFVRGPHRRQFLRSSRRAAGPLAAKWRSLGCKVKIVPMRCSDALRVVTG